MDRKEVEMLGVGIFAGGMSTGVVGLLAEQAGLITEQASRSVSNISLPVTLVLFMVVVWVVSCMSPDASDSAKSI